MGFSFAGIAAFLSLAPLTATPPLWWPCLSAQGSACLLSPLSHIFANGLATATLWSKSALAQALAILSAMSRHSSPRRPQAQSATAGLLCLLGIVFANFTVEPASQRSVQRSTCAVPNPHSLSLSPPSPLSSGSIPRPSLSSRTRPRSNPARGKAPRISGQTVSSISAPLCSAHSFSAAANCRSFWLPQQALSPLPAFFCSIPHVPFPPRSSIPIGVSLYSVALVAYPSLLSSATSTAQRGRQAGWIYAIAGWIGSALGIGMGQNLGHVPPAFVAVASAVVLFPVLVRVFRHRPRELALTCPRAPRRSRCVSHSTIGTRSRVALSHRTRPPRVHLRRLHPLPLAIRSTQYDRRTHVGTD